MFFLKLIKPFYMRMFFFLPAIIIVFCSCSSRVRIKKELFDKVDIGMTRDEVKAILGEPYDKRVSVAGDSAFIFVREKGLFVLKFADVYFDRSGRVRFLSYEIPDY